MFRCPAVERLVRRVGLAFFKQIFTPTGQPVLAFGAVLSSCGIRVGDLRASDRLSLRLSVQQPTASVMTLKDLPETTDASRLVNCL